MSRLAWLTDRPTDPRETGEVESFSLTHSLLANWSPIFTVVLGRADDWVRNVDAESLKYCDWSWDQAQAGGNFAIVDLLIS